MPTPSNPARAEAASASPQPQENSCGGYPPLCGRYRLVFRPEFHAAVSKFYHGDAGHVARQHFKRIVKDIHSFDIEAAKRRLRIGFDLDMPSANALLNNNGGELFTDEARLKAAHYLAAAPPKERQLFRETVGLIQPPSLTCLHKSKTKMDFAEERKFMKGEKMLRTGAKDVVGKESMHARSVPIDAACEVVGDGKSQYGFFYAWKVAPKLSTNVAQRAHDASYHGAPWGAYGSAEKSRWKTHQKEDMEDREYGNATTVVQTDDASGKMEVPKRRFGNYNDNVTHEMYRTQRLLRKGRALPGQTVRNATEVARASPDLLRPERAPLHKGEAYSPVFCR